MPADGNTNEPNAKIPLFRSFNAESQIFWQAGGCVDNWKKAGVNITQLIMI